MIIHHSEDLSKYQVSLCKPLKYSEDFTFVPIKISNKDVNHKCIFQTPNLFTPFGIQVLPNTKRIIDISFQNSENDNTHFKFLENLKLIYKSVYHKYKDKYTVNNFIKQTDYKECIRLKLSQNTSIYDDEKNIIRNIDKFSYGKYIIQLEGIWINKGDIWFQWMLLQAKVRLPTHLRGYSFIDEIHEVSIKEDKYTKMLKMGVPKEAVNRQKMLDGKIPPPPPPPPNLGSKNNNSYSIPKIKASDLQNVVLKKCKPISKPKIRRDPNQFEPPTIEELQSTLSRLRPTK
jgi:hypothetical protein